jgi:hypothetical protein
MSAEGTLSNSGLSEFQKIYEMLLSRAEHKPKRLVSPMLATENKRLIFLEGSDRPSTASITALSPSDGRIKISISEFAASLPNTGENQKRVNPDQNDTSVALWVQFGEQYVLLGADLEHTGHHGEGWLAVVEAFQGNSKAHIYKVPHHGSENAHHQEVWNQLLIPNPIAVVTPYSSGKYPLPRPSDLARMRELTSDLYCTSLGATRPPRRDSLVERFAKEIPRKAIDSRLGHVRLRWSPSQPVAKVELFNGAYKVQ